MSTPQPPGIPDEPAPPPPVPPSAAPAAGTESPPLEAPPETVAEHEDRPSTWQPLLYLKIAVLMAVVGYTIAFVVQNTRQIRIDFVFVTTTVHLIWEILLLLAVGLIGGVLLSQLYRHRRRGRLAQKAGKQSDSRADVRRRDKAVGKSR